MTAADCEVPADDGLVDLFTVPGWGQVTDSTVDLAIEMANDYRKHAAEEFSGP